VCVFILEHFLDLVNADFSDDAQVDRILDTWEELRPDANNSSHHRAKGFEDDDGQTGVTENKRAPIWKEIPIMFRRHIMLIIRDRTYFERSIDELFCVLVKAQLLFIFPYVSLSLKLSCIWVERSFS
jgi:hypothetical protein